MTIQWFPGHMAKAKRELKEKLKLVDLVIELVDARAPISSQNPMLQEEIGEKRKLVVLMKNDLADETLTNRFIELFTENETDALPMNVNDRKDIQALIKKVNIINEEINKKRSEKGIKPRPLRAMIIGIPNVGKSTLINRLANKKRAQTGNKPGVTKKQQWIKVEERFELLDTPGILWPKFEDQEIGLKLAAISSIKDEIIHLDDVAVYVLNMMKDHYEHQLLERYPINLNDDVVGWFDAIGKKRGCLGSGGIVDYDKTTDVIINDFREGKLGRITLDRPSN